ncbi:phosphoprotein [Maraba virus]|uniref:Phosphoprotein n=1 Tax=Maraba virus TaxID=1046251 RepID=F8SPF1_9RHAB|nr:phosphoprotein [Maraba virus]AEI52256.1 phosphoprotein [Maraba virus]AEM60939.1 phosphoprotein [Vesicular stomatitis virus]WQG18844.1 phosphoprotein [Vesiculovirus maraba]
MDQLSKVKEFLKTYAQLDQAVQEMDDIESQREEKTNFDLFQEEGLEIKEKPSYYRADEEEIDSDEDSVDDAQDLGIRTSTSPIEGYVDEEQDDYEDEEVNVVFTSDWKQPELESDGDGKTLRLTIPDGLTGEQKSQWLATIKAVVQSAKYWNISECSFESYEQGVLIRERQMTPDVYKVTPVLNAPPVQMTANQDVWSLSSTPFTFLPKKQGVTPLTMSLEELFNTRGEFISLGGNGKMSHREAIILGLRHKKLYNQARLKYNLA